LGLAAPESDLAAATGGGGGGAVLRKRPGLSLVPPALSLLAQSVEVDTSLPLENQE
jgi:hypothetical protein